MNHLLSIIIPVFNAEKFLENSLQSVLNQTYKDIEVILVDDGSTDHSSMLIDKATKKDPRIKAFHKENSGVSATRNFGITKATGDLIAFVDADDQLDPIMYEVLINALDNTESDISACAYKKEHSVNDIRLQGSFDVVPSPITFCNLGDIYTSVTRKNQSIEGYIWNKVWKTSLLENHRFRTNIQMCEDSIFTWEVMKDVHKACYVDIPLYHYLIQADSSTRKANYQQCLTAIESYEIMLNDSDLLTTECVVNLSKQYLIWNIMAFKSLIGENYVWSQEYRLIQKNVEKKSNYINMLTIKNRIEAKAIRKNFGIGRQTVKMLEGITKILKR